MAVSWGRGVLYLSAISIIISKCFTKAICPSSCFHCSYCAALPPPQPTVGQNAGLGIRSLVFRVNLLFFCEQKSDSLVKKSKSLLSLLCHEWPEQNAHGRTFVKSDKSELLPTLLKKRVTEQRATGAICSVGIKKGKLWKTVKNTQKICFFKWIACFLKAIHSNHKQITGIALF